MGAVRRSGLVAVCLGAAVAAPAAPDPARVPFLTRGEIPRWAARGPVDEATLTLGQQVFNTQFVAAGTPGAGRRAGLGPLYNNPSCDSCHNDGARAAGPTGDGEVAGGFVLQLAAPATAGVDAPGDPIYGHTLNVAAVAPVSPEGSVRVRYSPIPGHYADGSDWQLREPHYEVRELATGPLAPDTILGPRIAPALFGIGLLEATAPDPAAPGRFGWQGSATSVRDQTARAFAREMGLTSAEYPADDCTAIEHCPAPSRSPELDPALLDALVRFEQRFAVPTMARDPAIERPGEKLFARLGCAGCHAPTLPVADAAVRAAGIRAIHPYTDLKRHDLGEGLADRDASDHPVTSRWRTAPLWGIGFRLRPVTALTFLHDGRARTIAEAILWHGGEARGAREAFLALPVADRALLERWVLER